MQHIPRCRDEGRYIIYIIYDTLKPKICRSNGVYWCTDIKLAKLSFGTIDYNTHHFVPVAVETSGAFGPDALDLFRDLGRRIRAITLEVKSRAYLIQQVSVAVQRGNALAVMGTFSSTLLGNF